MNPSNEIKEANAAFEALLVKFDQTDSTLVITASARDSNLRDVLMHLVRWQELLEARLRETGKSLLPEGYTWDNFQELNQVFHDEGQDKSFEATLARFKSNHKNLVSLFENLEDTRAAEVSEDFALITYKHYPWAVDMIDQSTK